jgi:hypothetical protein
MAGTNRRRAPIASTSAAGSGSSSRKVSPSWTLGGHEAERRIPTAVDVAGSSVTELDVISASSST